MANPTETFEEDYDTANKSDPDSNYVYSSNGVQKKFKGPRSTFDPSDINGTSSRINQVLSDFKAGKIPSYKKGGKTTKTGLAYLHKGERVLTKKQNDSMGKALNKKKEYKGLKGEYSKTQQGNFMKVHPLDRI